MTRYPGPSRAYLERRYGKQEPRPELTQLQLKLSIDKATKAHDQRQDVAKALMIASQICVYVIIICAIIYGAAIVAATVHEMELM